MNFKEWLEHQQLFPFMTQEDPPDLEKMRRYKTQDAYVKAQSRYGANTGEAAKSVISASPGTIRAPRNEKVVEITPNALTIPEYQFPSGRVRPQKSIAFVHFETEEPVNPNVPEYNKKQYRILAYYQGDKPTFSKEDLEFSTPLGGLMGMGGYITHVWVDEEYRGTPKAGIPNLYKALMEFARQRGIHGIMPEDATCPNCGNTVRVQYDRKKCPECGHYARPLNSREFKAAQAKYDWKRAHATQNAQPNAE